MIVRRSLVALVTGLCLALAPAVGHAQEDARTLFQRGQTAYSQGDYDAAIEQWTRAYELDARPLLQFNLSQALERLGRLEDAIAALERYLEHADPGDEHQADARARLSGLRERLARTSVRIVGGPEGATILIDGEDCGRTPRPDPIQVAPGSHRIVMRAEGYDELVSSVVVPAGQSIEVPIEMRPISGGGDVTGSGDELPIVPIILFSAGGAALIAGAVMGGIALSDAESAPGRESPEADAARALALGADITMGAGVALAAAGLIVLLVSDSGGQQETAGVSLAPWGGTSGGGIVVSGSF